MADERRRAQRHPVRIAAKLLLGEGREAPVVIENIGEMGALVSVTDLEVDILEGERTLLEHPRIVDGRPLTKVVRTPGAIVRIDMDMDPAGIVKHLAIYFDGGPAPR
jgi:hypothetical protein